jgi:hypothetical protein
MVMVMVVLVRVTLRRVCSLSPCSVLCALVLVCVRVVVAQRSLEIFKVAQDNIADTTFFAYLGNVQARLGCELFGLVLLSAGVTWMLKPFALTERCERRLNGASVCSGRLYHQRSRPRWLHADARLLSPRALCVYFMFARLSHAVLPRSWTCQAT